MGGRGRNPTVLHSRVGGRLLSALLLCKNACLLAFRLGGRGHPRRSGALLIPASPHPFFNCKGGFFKKMVLRFFAELKESMLSKLPGDLSVQIQLLRSWEPQSRTIAIVIGECLRVVGSTDGCEAGLSLKQTVPLRPGRDPGDVWGRSFKTEFRLPNFC